MSAKKESDYAPRIRKALFEGLLKAAKDKNQTLSDYCKNWWDEDWKKAADTMARLAPREFVASGKIEHDHQHDHRHTHESVSQTDEWLAKFTVEDQENPTEKTVSH